MKGQENDSVTNDLALTLHCWAFVQLGFAVKKLVVVLVASVVVGWTVNHYYFYKQKGQECYYRKTAIWR